jgi:hypothetical protein
MICLLINKTTVRGAPMEKGAKRRALASRSGHWERPLIEERREQGERAMPRAERRGGVDRTYEVPSG